MRLAIHDQNVTLSARAIHLIKIERDASESAELIQTPTTPPRTDGNCEFPYIYAQRIARLWQAHSIETGAEQKCQLNAHSSKNDNNHHHHCRHRLGFDCHFYYFVSI